MTRISLCSAGPISCVPCADAEGDASHKRDKGSGRLVSESRSIAWTFTKNVRQIGQAQRDRRAGIFKTGEYLRTLVRVLEAPKTTIWTQRRKRRRNVEVIVSRLRMM